MFTLRCLCCGAWSPVCPLVGVGSGAAPGSAGCGWCRAARMSCARGIHEHACADTLLHGGGSRCASGFAGNGDTLEAPPCPWVGGRGQQMEQYTAVNVLLTAPRPTPETPFCAVKRGTEGDTPGGHRVSTSQQRRGAQGHCLLAKPKKAREEETH